MTSQDLKKARLKLGYSRNEMAAFLSLGVRGYGHLEKGQNAISQARENTVIRMLDDRDKEISLL